MTKKTVLFVYTSSPHSGLSTKAKKIEQGFRDKGFILESLYFNERSNKVVQLLDLLLLNWRYMIKILLFPPDIIYVRYAYYFGVIYGLSLLFNRKIQIEINGNVQCELYRRGHRKRARIDEIVDRLAVKASSRVHVVSQQLATIYGQRYPQANIVFTPNFVVDEFYQVKRQKMQGEKTNIVFLGDTNQSWHAVDTFMELFIVNQDWFSTSCKLHIIGRVSDRIKKLIDEYDLGDVVITYGFLLGEKKRQVLNQIDIGIGSFNLEVKGLSETTSIKNGEYIYSGLGLILGYEDPIIPSTLPFVLKVDMKGSIDVERKKLRRFIETFNDSPDWGYQAHIYAKNNLLVDRYIGNIVDA